MISRTFSTLFVILATLVALVGCQKDAGFGEEVVPEALARTGGSAACDALVYSDTLFYYSDQSGNNVEKPLNRRAGTYSSFPVGLAINSNTGAIDINKSESGLKYRIWFKPKGSLDSCSTDITISGINFQSRIYNLSKGDSIVTPFYNASADLPCPCAGNAKKGKVASGCEFNNKSDVSIVAVANVSGKKRQPVEVEMDAETGAINMAKTLRNGLLGTNPANGAMQEFRLYYRLNDKSKKALNYIDVRVHYYKDLKTIPASLLEQLNYKTTANFRIATAVNTQNMMAANSETDPSVKESRPTRPPDIVVH